MCLISPQVVPLFIYLSQLVILKLNSPFTSHMTISATGRNVVLFPLASCSGEALSRWVVFKRTFLFEVNKLFVGRFILSRSFLRRYKSCRPLFTIAVSVFYKMHNYKSALPLSKYIISTPNLSLRGSARNSILTWLQIATVY